MTQMHTTWRDVDVSAYVDGELDQAAHTAFETALAEDRALWQKVEEMREVVALVRATPLREPPRNYLLTPSMVTEKSVTEKSPQRAQRRPTSFLFMRLATSLAAIAFVVTAGLTYLQRGVTPMMLQQAPRAADEVLLMESRQDVAVTVEVEVEVMRVSESEAPPPEPAARIEEDAQAEKVVGAEAPVAALAPAPPDTTPQPDGGGGDANAIMQEIDEPYSLEEGVALEYAAATEAPATEEGERDRSVENIAGTFSGAEEEQWRMGENTAGPTDAAHYEKSPVEPLRTPSWWLPAVLGVVMLLLAGITYWIPRRR